MSRARSPHFEGLLKKAGESLNDNATSIQQKRNAL